MKISFCRRLEQGEARNPIFPALHSYFIWRLFRIVTKEVFPWREFRLGGFQESRGAFCKSRRIDFSLMAYRAFRPTTAAWAFRSISESNNAS